MTCCNLGPVFFSGFLRLKLVLITLNCLFCIFSISLSRGELHASKWCRRTKKRSIKEGEGRERNLASQGVTAIYIDKKGNFRPRAGNNITRAKARHTPFFIFFLFIKLCKRRGVEI